jgi:hypothetical protein
MATTFVLITGAWHGGWAWRPVAQELRAAGCRVLTPTLPGLHDGDDPTAHTLDDVIDYLARLADDQDLRDVTLLGPYEVWRSAFINDASEDVARVTHSLLLPHPFQYFTQPVAPLDPHALGIPASYVISTEDISMPPGDYGFQRFADRLGVAPLMTPGSHEVCFTQPASLAGAFLKA